MDEFDKKIVPPRTPRDDDEQEIREKGKVLERIQGSTKEIENLMERYRQRICHIQEEEIPTWRARSEKSTELIDKGIAQHKIAELKAEIQQLENSIRQQGQEQEQEVLDEIGEATASGVEATIRKMKGTLN